MHIRIKNAGYVYDVIATYYYVTKFQWNWQDRTNLTPPLLIEVPVPSQGN